MRTRLATLVVPDIPAGISTLEAALLYAGAGWYVVPIARGTKNPGSVLGKGWQQQSTREPDVVVAWFAGTDHGLALHVGRSGAVVFDLDHPELVPAVLREANLDAGPPMQQTRLDGRGHVVYLQPEGRPLGNGNGTLGTAWGDVRGQNGVILVEPTEHPDGGRYRWLRTGPVPPLPAALEVCLPSASVAEVMASDGQVEAFLASHRAETMPAALDVVLAMVDRELETSARHPLFVSWTATAMREAAAGLYDAGATATELESRFIQAEGKGAGRVRQPREQASEWQGILSWAVGQALGSDTTATRQQAEAALGPALSLNGQPRVEPPAPNGAEAPTLRSDLARAVAKLDLAAEAVRFIAERDATAVFAGFDGGTLGDILARPAPPPGRVSGLMGWSASTLVSAQRKTGKTTLTLNLARCLLTGQPFLGASVIPLTGHVTLLNFEVSAQQIAAWADDNGLPHDRLRIVNLRGRGNPLIAGHSRDRLAEFIAGTEALIVDPFSMAYPGDDENQAGEVRKFLSLLETFARQQVGASDLIVTAHAGHDPKRTRGSSALEDWPDTVLRMRADDDGQRYVMAMGRDVELDWHELHYDRLTRALTLGEPGSIEGHQAEATSRQRDTERLADVVAAVAERSGLSANELSIRVGGRRQTALAAIKLAVAQGLIRVEAAPNRQALHFPRLTQ